MLNLVILSIAIFIGVFAASLMSILVIFNVMTSKAYLRKVVKMTKKIEEIQYEDEDEF